MKAAATAVATAVTIAGTYIATQGQKIVEGAKTLLQKAGQVISNVAGKVSDIVNKGKELELRFAQKTASSNFDADGSFSGRTIGQVAQGLRDGAIEVGDVAVNYISRGGTNLIENTRSALALMRSGIPQNQWNLLI